MEDREIAKSLANNFWKNDLFQIRRFKKVAVVSILIPFLTLLLFSASAIFGVVATGIYFVIVLVGFKLYDVYEYKKYRVCQWDWEKAMKEDGWQQLAKNRWKKKSWDSYKERYVIHTYFTDELISKRLVSSRLKARRHISYVVCRKRINRKTGDNACLTANLIRRKRLGRRDKRP